MAKEQLTKRQMQVALLVDEGLTNREIAKGLAITVETVKVHIRNIRQQSHLNGKRTWASGLVSDAGNPNLPP